MWPRATSMALSAGRPWQLTQTLHPQLTGAVTSDNNEKLFIMPERGSKAGPHNCSQVCYHCTSQRLVQLLLFKYYPIWIIKMNYLTFIPLKHTFVEIHLQLPSFAHTMKHYEKLKRNLL